MIPTRFLLPALLLLGACASGPRPLEVRLNSFVAPSGQLSTDFALAPSPVEGELEAVVEQSLRADLRQSLQMSGFRETSPADAGIRVQMEHTVSGPREVEEVRRRPIWGRTGVRAAHTICTTVVGSDGMERRIYRTIYTPDYDIVGYESHPVRHRVFDVSLQLTAQHLRGGEASGLAWSLKAECVSPSGDPRTVIPQMLAASMPYLGRDSGQEQVIPIEADDPRLLLLRGAELP